MGSVLANKPAVQSEEVSRGGSVAMAAGVGDR